MPKQNTPTAPEGATLTVTTDDCPHDDVATVVSGGDVSNALVLYVRWWMAAKHQDDAALFEGSGSPPTPDREDIASEVFDACDLESHDEPHGTAWTIAEAAGWTLLGGPMVRPEPDETKSASPRAALIDALNAGECPDGGGPQCVCKKSHACVALSPYRDCKTCDADGLFRLGMFTDVCGMCLGSKVVDDDILDAIFAPSGVAGDS